MVRSNAVSVLIWRVQKASHRFSQMFSALYKAGIHPKTRINTLSANKKENLYFCVKTILQEIFQAGGRNSETDLFGKSGGYIPFLSKDTSGKPCPRCGETIRKENYLGGSIYYCIECQK